MNYNILRNPNAFNPRPTSQHSETKSAQKILQACPQETLAIIRTALADMLIGINQYEKHISEISEPQAKALFEKIKKQKVISSGELLSALNNFCPSEEKLRNQGINNFLKAQDN